MINSYLFPKNTSIIKNSDHHVLEHIGYRFTDSVFLVNSGDPQNSLWDNKTGILKISFPGITNPGKCRMEISDFYEPVFVKKDGERYHSLINQYFNLSTNNSFVIRTRTDTIIGITIRHFRKDSSNYVIKWEGVEHVSRFNTFLNKGYPLNDIIYQANTLSPQAKVDLTNFFEGTFLLRNKLISTNLADNNENSQTPDLTIFPGNNLLDLIVNNEYNLFICGDKISIASDSVKSEFSFDFSGELFFWTGFGRTMGNYMHLINKGYSHLELNFYYPVRYNLKPNFTDNKQVNQVITTLYNTVADSSQTNKGYLFNGPFYENNSLHINADLGYLTADSRSAMQFIINDYYISADSIKNVNYDIYKANDTILLSTSSGQFLSDNPFNNKWIFRISDSRSQSPIKIIDFYLIMLVFFVFIIIRLYFLNGKNILISAIELSVYILLYVFIIVKMLLLWRMYVFLPADSSRFLKVLTNPEHYYWTIIPLLSFFFIWGVFLFLRKTGVTAILTRRFFAYYFRLFLYVSAIITMYFACKSLSDRFIDIVFPLFFYFSSYFWLISIKEQRFIKKEYRFFLINTKLISLIKIVVHVITILLLSGIFGINNGDMGFLIIFCLFLLLYKLFSSFLIKNAFVRLSVVCILLTGTICFIIFHNKCISTIITTAESITENWSDTKLITRKIKENISSKDYIQSRAEIFSRPVDSLLMNEKYGSSKADQLIFSALNQWYINQYIAGNNYKQYTETTDQSKKYFNIRPHSNQGASYTAQTTDLVVSRYIIGEHGEIVVILLITILLVFILIYITSYLIFILHENKLSGSNIYSKLILKSIILLFTIAFFVWMTATNRFTFFGQDFPIISLTSKMSICLSLGIMLLVLTTINNNYLKSIVQLKYMPSSLKNAGLYYFLLIYFIFSFAYFSESGNKQTINNIKNSSVNNIGLLNTGSDFDLPDLMKSCENKINELSEAFIIYQISENSRDLTSDVRILRFYEQEEENIRNILENANEFVRSAFEKFITDEYDKENENNLIYLSFEDGIYHINLNNSYYLVQGIKGS